MITVIVAAIALVIGYWLGRWYERHKDDEDLQ